MASMLTQKKVSRLTFGAGILLAGLMAGQSAAQFEEFLLPDMMPWISDNRGYSHGWRLNGSETEFSATSTPLNTGPGHLEMHDDLDQGGTGQNDIDIYQRLYREDGTHEDFLAGNFINHPSHGHFHFEGYAQMRLRDVGAGNSIGDIAAQGDKTSFCMIDLSSFGGSSNYFGCGRGTQGISSNYADVYSSGLDGQQIDVSGLSRDGNGNFNGGLNGTGVYWFEIVIDPDNRMIESNNHNNVAQLLIDLNGTEGAALDDHSNSKVNATVLNSGDHRFGELGQNGDVDFFRATVREDALYMVSMDELQLSRGDFTVRDTTDTQVFYDDISGSGQQFTSHEFRANADGEYTLEVGEVGNLGSRDGSYMVNFELLRIAGDANGDDVVNAADLDMLLANWGQTVAANTSGDVNGDGTVDGADQAIIDAHHGETLADYAVSVPEPGSLALLGLGGLALLRRRR